MNWVLLSVTRRKCLWVWIVFTAIVVLWTLLQTLTGLLDELAAPVGWLWVALQIFPGLVVLFVSVLYNRYPAKVIPVAAHRALWLGAMSYLLLVVFTLMAEPLAIQGDLGIIGYLEMSYMWLLPFQLVLLGGFVLAFFRKESIFLPNEKILLEVASRNAEKWQVKGDTVRSGCFEKIAAGDIKGGFETVKMHLSTDDNRQSEVALLQGDFSRLQQNIDLNLVSREEGQRQLNRITMALLNIIEKL